MKNKWPRPYIKSNRIEGVRENDVIMKYRFYQDEILWLTDKFPNNIERDAEGSGIVILVKLYEVNSISLP